MAAAFDTSKAAPQALRVLVVEDDEAARELTKEVLHAAGVRDVVLAETAESGLERLRCEAYDLIVADIRLPQASGLEMIDQASAEGRLVGTAVVVCSGSHWRRGQALERGATFIAKHLCVETLVDVVHGLNGKPSVR
jgi:CheY-like chemotaxis protein